MTSPTHSELTKFQRLCEQMGGELDLTDPETIDALMEGETNLKEMAQDLLDELDAVEVLQVGLKYKADQLTDRLSLQKRRVDGIKSMLGRIMEECPDKSLRLDSATITMANGTQSVVITDESSIPFDLMKTPQPTPDKKAILTELKEGRDVAGCTLSNGAPSLRIRRK